MNQSIRQQISEEISPLWRFALTLCNAKVDAEDLLQKTVLRALEKSDQYQDGTKLRSWLFSIMHSLWLNEKRTFKVRAKALSSFFNHDTNEQSVVTGLWQSSLHIRDDAQEQHQLLVEVLETVMSLPEAQRYVVILVCVEGFSYQEAANILEVKTGTIMSRLARARLLIGGHFLNTEIHKQSAKRPNQISSSKDKEASIREDR